MGFFKIEYSLVSFFLVQRDLRKLKWPLAVILEITGLKKMAQFRVGLVRMCQVSSFVTGKNLDMYKLTKIKVVYAT